MNQQIKIMNQQIKIMNQQIKSPRTTFFISDYSLFTIVLGNRPIKENSKLLRELKEYGQIIPIIVKKLNNGQLLIIDGQNRMNCLKQLNYSVECLEIDSDNEELPIIISANNSPVRWTKENFTNCYCKMGNINYIKLMDYVQKYRNLKIEVIYSVALGIKGGNFTELNRTGKLIFDTISSEKEEKLEILNYWMGLLIAERAKLKSLKQYVGHFASREISNNLYKLLDLDINFTDVEKILSDKAGIISRDTFPEAYLYWIKNY